MSEIICYCKNVTKSEIGHVIAKGAKTLGDIQTLTGACTGNRCKELNPSGKCCSEEIKVMLKENHLKVSSHCCCCK